MLQEISVFELEPQAAFMQPLYTAGVELLHKPGNPLTSIQIECLQNLNLSPLYIAETEDDLDQLKFLLEHRLIDIDDPLLTTADHKLRLDIFSRWEQLLASAGTIWDTEIKRRLLQRAHEEIYVMKENIDDQHELYEEYLKFCDKKQASINNEVRALIIKERMKGNDNNVSRFAVSSNIPKPDISLDELYLDTGLDKEQEKRIIKSRIADGQTKNEWKKFIVKENLGFELFYNKCLETLENFYSALSQKSVRYDNKSIQLMAKKIVSDWVNISRYLQFRINGKIQEDKVHVQAFNTAVFAVSIAKHFEFPDSIVELLAEAGFLFNIGISRVDKSILQKSGKLTHEELLTIRKYSLYSSNIIKSFTEPPKYLDRIIPQITEACDGSSFPRGFTRFQIHPFARIISAANTYCAMIAKRSYRDAKIPAMALEETLHFGQKNVLDIRVTQALYTVLGKIPIGSWIETQTGERAQIVIPVYGNESPKIQYLSAKKELITEDLETTQKEFRLVPSLPL